MALAPPLLSLSQPAFQVWQSLHDEVEAELSVSRGRIRQHSRRNARVAAEPFLRASNTRGIPWVFLSQAVSDRLRHTIGHPVAAGADVAECRGRVATRV
jgi:hypothetical protein